MAPPATRPRPLAHLVYLRHPSLQLLSPLSALHELVLRGKCSDWPYVWVDWRWLNGMTQVGGCGCILAGTCGPSLADLASNYVLTTCFLCQPRASGAVAAAGCASHCTPGALGSPPSCLYLYARILQPSTTSAAAA